MRYALFLLPIIALPTTALAAGAEALEDVVTVENSSDERVEFTMGFSGGRRSYLHRTFTREAGAELPDGGAWREPFTQHPFDEVTVLGLTYDVRMTMSHLRMTAGVDIPFSQLEPSAATRDYPVAGGAERTVVVESLVPISLRFGLGTEYSFGRFSPFVDLLGSVHWVWADVVVDGERAEYATTGFGFSVRGGVRVQLRDWLFAQVSGSAGIEDDVKWSTALSVGFSVQ